MFIRIFDYYCHLERLFLWEMSWRKAEGKLFKKASMRFGRSHQKFHNLLVNIPLCLSENTKFKQYWLFSISFFNIFLTFWLSVAQKYYRMSNSQDSSLHTSAKLHAATGPRDLLKKWLESHKLFWEVHLSASMNIALFQLPAVGPTSALLAMLLKQSICFVTSQVLLSFLTSSPFLQNHFFITSSHLFVTNNSDLHLTNQKVNSHQIKCSPSWWRTV